MSLFTTWTNISPVAAAKVQLSHPSPLCFLTQHLVSGAAQNTGYNIRPGVVVIGGVVDPAKAVPTIYAYW